MKNKGIMKSNLSEAVEQLNDIIARVDDPDYSEAKFMVQLEHAYHHMNFAWHIRTESENDVIECTAENFKRWSKYPAGELDEYD